MLLSLYTGVLYCTWGVSIIQDKYYYNYDMKQHGITMINIYAI